MFLTKRMTLLLAGALLYVFSASYILAHADAIPGTRAENSMDCNGPKCPGVDGGDDNDTLTAERADARKDKKENKEKKSFETGTLLADASVTAETTVVGIDGSNGKDVIVNNGDLLLEDSDSGEVDISWTLTGSEEADGTTTLTSEAVGIASGNGPDKISNANTGKVTVETISELTNVAISMDLSGASHGDASSNIDSYAVGIDSGNGSDRITNAKNGEIVSGATSRLEDDDFDVRLELYDSSYGEAVPSLVSTAVGIQGGDAKDTIDNKGAITVNALSEINIESNEVNLIDAAQSAQANASIYADAYATGLNLSRGKDSVVKNSGTITSKARSEAELGDTNFSYLDITYFDNAGGSATTELSADSAGIVGGSGKDDITVTNGGEVNAIAEAYGYSWGIAVASEGAPAGIGSLLEGTLNDASVKSNTTVTGIEGDSGNDRITCDGTVKASADSTAIQWNANLGVALIDYHVPTPGIVIGGAGTEAVAEAVGIGGGDNNDDITIGGLLDVDASSEASALTVSTNLDIDKLETDFANKWDKYRLPITGSFVAADTSATAFADAVGVAGGSGNDHISNTGITDVDAVADNETVALGVDLGWNMEKETEGTEDLGFLIDADAVLARAVTYGDAAAVGFDLGTGNDEVNNDGELHVDSIADLTSVSVTTTFQATRDTYSIMAGGALSDTSTEGYTTTNGILGGEGNDMITNSNEGSITAKAESDVAANSVSVTADFAEKGIIAGAAVSRSETIADASATGIDTGDGVNLVKNEGELDVDAISDISCVAASLDSRVSWEGKGAVLGAAVSDTSATGISDAAGILGGSGQDKVTNTATGNISVDATSEIDIAAISLEVGIANQGVAAGGALSDSEAKAGACAEGIITGDGKDDIVNDGTLNVATLSDISSASVSVDILGTLKEGAVLGASLSDNSITAISDADGINGGGDKDTITNSGDINVNVNPAADATAASVNVTGGFAKKGLVGGVALARSTNNSNVYATGIDGGSDDDWILNSGNVTVGFVPDDENVMADALATSVSVVIGGTMEGAALGAAVTDASTTATADATGIYGGFGRDTILNESIITANPSTSADARSASGSAEFAKGGVAVGVALSRATNRSEATASGMDGGEDNDLLVNNGTINVGFTPEEDVAMAKSFALSMGVTVGGTMEGLAVGAAVTDTSSDATATAVGMDGGTGDDEIFNTNTVAVCPSSEAVATGVSAVVEVAKGGVAGGVALSNSATTSKAVGTGLDGNDGNDYIRNTGAITVGADPEESEAMARATATSVSVSIAGTAGGGALGLPISDSSATATSDIRGIDGGGGDDRIDNEDVVTAYSSSETDSTSASASLTITGKGVSGGLAMARATNNSYAYATGIDGGDGEDGIWNEGAVNVKADSYSVSKAVGLAISGTGSGVALGGALTDGSATATSDAKGIDGGGGEDVIDNNEAITVDADSETKTIAVSVDISIAGTGVSEAAALSRTTSTSEAIATGIDGGEGIDSIDNDADVTADAWSKASADTVSVSLGAAVKGAALGAALTDGSATATSDATGIQGGGGDDVLMTSTHKISAIATSEADATSVSVEGTGSIGLAAGASVAKSTAEADAYSTGIDGGLGNDFIDNASNIDASSSSTADAAGTAVGVSIGVVAGGYGLSDSSATATAESAGIEGGVGNDTINHAEGSIINAASTATTEADSVTVSVISAPVGGGVAQSDAYSLSSASAYGIAGGDGMDVIINSGDINATTEATCDLNSTSVQITLAYGAGYADADGSVTSETTAVGISGGQDDDVIINTGTITAGSDPEKEWMSHASLKSKSFSLTGASSASGSVTATSDATGISGDEGADFIDNAGGIIVNVKSKAYNSSKSLVLLGATEASGEVAAEATAIGINGGTGGDTILNSGEIDLTAISDSDASTLSLSLFGKATSGDDRPPVEYVDAGSKAGSSLVGIDGGSGDDYIANNEGARITITGKADAYASSVSGTFAGEAEGNASTAAKVDAKAIEGGEGEDDIFNFSELIIELKSKADGSAKAGVIFGGAEAEAGALALVDAVGISGGSYNDFIVNTAMIDIGLAPEDIDDWAMSDAYASGYTWNLIGSSWSKATLMATSQTAGIDGGEGDDIISNTDNAYIIANSTSYAYAKGIAKVGMFGDPQAYSRSRADATAAGITGGGGEDTIDNDGTVEAYAKAIADGASDAEAGWGHPRTDTLSQANAAAVGLDGGENSSIIDNSGTVRADAHAESNPSADSDSDVGTNYSYATAGSSASAHGILTGVDADSITNDTTGLIIVKARAEANPSSTPDESSGAQAGIDDDPEEDYLFEVSATGIATGGGIDEVVNHGAIEVTAEEEALAKSLSGSVSLDAESNATVYSTVEAAGIALGQGDDEVQSKVDSDGDITVAVLVHDKAVASAVLKYDDKYHTDIANAKIGVEDAPLTVSASGIHAQGGSNDVTNVGDILVSTEVEAEANAYADTQIEQNESKAYVGMIVSAAGIHTGAGDDDIVNDVVNDTEGSITVNTLVTVGDTDEMIEEAEGTEEGEDKEFLASADERATAMVGGERGSDWVLTVNATGVDAGDGENEVVNRGSIVVDAREYAHPVAECSSRLIIDDIFSKAFIGTTVDAVGIRSGAGDDVIMNEGAITVTALLDGWAEGKPKQDLGADHGWAVAGRDPVLENIDPDNALDFLARAQGISVAGGENVIHTYGPILAEATAIALAQANTHTESTAEHAYAKAYPRAEAAGIVVGEGENEIVNGHELTVRATADADAVAAISADSLGGIDDYADAYSGAWAEANGIMAEGSNSIVNQGQIDVWAEADAYSDATADVRTEIAHAFAEACGIRVDGSHDNHIDNFDSLTVQSLARAEPGPASSIAIGIGAGDGDGAGSSYITNAASGSINVTAILDYKGNDDFELQATGILTGSGDDVIINSGTITATNEIREGDTSVQFPGVAIEAGGGNDSVSLLDGSSVSGSIELRDGNDRLTVSGSVMFADPVSGGVGTDTLILDGVGNVNSNLTEFETAIKQGTGTFAVGSLETMERLEVHEGTLQIDDNYNMVSDSTFQATVYGGGDHGQLLINGDAEIDGILKVIAGPGAYIDGTKYDILQANRYQDQGRFSNEILPQTPLVSFNTNYLEHPVDPDVVEIKVSTNSFTTVATNAVQGTIAQQLDKITPAATGDLSQAIGEFQLSSPSEYETAFSSLSPVSYDNATRTTFDVTRQYTKTVQQHMNTARSNLRTSRNGFKAKGPSEQAPLLLAYNGSDASIGQLFNPRQQEKAQAKYGLWLDGFGQWGDQDEDDGFVGFDYRMLGTALGFDYMLSDKLIAGVSVDYAYTDIDLDANQEDESIRSTGGSVYGSYFNESAYIEAILSYAKQRFDNDRHVVIGSMQRTAESDHNGDAFSTFFGGGYNFPLNNWAVGPFASLQYTYLDEESFQESGAGGLNLRIDSRETESLVSELGVRVARKLLETDCWRLIPEISAAWNYDFDIDDRDITASFAGLPGTSFTIEGQDIENSGATFSAGLRLMHKGGLMTSLEYNAEFREDYSAHGLIGEVQYQF